MAAPLAAAAGLGAVASIGGGIMGKSAAKKAAGQQGGAAQQAYDRLATATSGANSTLTGAYRNAAGQLQPWETAGGNALNQLQWGLGQDSQVYDPSNQLGPRKTAADYKNELTAQFTTPGAKNKYGQLKAGAHDTVNDAGLNAAIASAMAADDAKYQAAANSPQFQGQGEQGGLLRNFQQSDFQVDPGYQFAVDEGQRGIQNSAAAGGNLLSGATLKALTRFNQDTANNQYQNSYNRFNQNQQNQLNSLFNLSGVGQNAASQIGQYGMTTGGQVAGNQMALGGQQASLTQQQGAAAASGTMGGANALTQGIGGALNQIGGYAAMSKFGSSLGGMGRQSSYAPLFGQPGSNQNPFFY